MHCKWLVQLLCEEPLRELYFKGPRFQGYGFWNGLPLSDICAQLTHTASEMWVSNNIVQCTVITDRYFQAFFIGTYGIVYIIMLHNLLTSFQNMSMLHYQYRLFSQIQNTKALKE
jgi:hypothetical protein